MAVTDTGSADANEQVAQIAQLYVDDHAYKAALKQKLRQLQPGETMAAYSARVGEALDLKHCCVVHNMVQDGIYLYKRPVRGASAAGNLLGHAGSIFHHILLYVKSAEGLVALEMGPNGDADVASNIFEAVEAGPIECHSAAPPEDNSPLLHIDAPHHPLSHPAVRDAVAFAQAQQYHTVHSNCIQFVDFMVRLLTGGAVLGAPLAYDVMCGNVPPVDSPLLSMLGMLRLTWLDVCDGSRLMSHFLQQHAPPPALGTPHPPPAATGGSTTEFLSAAVSAAHSSGGAEPAAVAHVAEAEALPDLAGMLRSVLTAAQSGQQGGATRATNRDGSGSGLAGLLSAALAGGMQEAGAGSGHSGSANGGGGGGGGDMAALLGGFMNRGGLALPAAGAARPKSGQEANVGGGVPALPAYQKKSTS